MCVSGEQELYSQLCSVSLSGISLSDDNNNKLRTFPSQREESSKRIWNERMLFYLSNSRSSSSIFLGYFFQCLIVQSYYSLFILSAQLLRVSHQSLKVFRVHPFSCYIFSFFLIFSLQSVLIKFQSSSSSRKMAKRQSREPRKRKKMIVKMVAAAESGI